MNQYARGDIRYYVNQASERVEMSDIFDAINRSMVHYMILTWLFCVKKYGNCLSSDDSAILHTAAFHIPKHAMS